MKQLFLALAALLLLGFVGTKALTEQPQSDKPPQREPFRPPPLPGQPQRDPTRPFEFPPTTPPSFPGQPGGFQPGGPPPGPQREVPDDVIRALKDALKDNDLEVKKLAAATLVRLRKGAQATATLIDMLNNESADTRKFAVDNLAIAGGDAVDALTDALKSKDKDTRANAAYALAKIGPSANPATANLLKLIKDDETDVRRRVLYALNRIYTDNPNPQWWHAFPPGTFPPSVPSGGSGAGSEDAPPQVPDPGVLGPAKKGEK